MERFVVPTIMLGITPFELKQLYNKMPEMILLDVRSPLETKRGIIAGAYLIPIGRLLDYIGREPLSAKDRPVVVYCHAGQRSAAACQLLAEGGYQRLYNLEGGIVAYRKANFNLVKPQKRDFS